MTKNVPHGHSTRTGHLRLFLILLYGHYSWLARGLVASEDGGKAPRIVANRARLLEQTRQRKAELMANLRFLERIGYIYAVKESLYNIHATLRLPSWICTMDSNVLSVLKLDLIHADASLLQRLPKTTKSPNCSTRRTNTTSTEKKSSKHKREHPGSLPILKGDSNG